VKASKLTPLIPEGPGPSIDAVWSRPVGLGVPVGRDELAQPYDAYQRGCHTYWWACILALQREAVMRGSRPGCTRL
jgi:hypothetical protein